MTRIMGENAGEVLPDMTRAERERFADDLQSALVQLANIPNSSSGLICGCDGGACLDGRITCRGYPTGSFRTEEELNKHLTDGLPLFNKLAERVKEVHSKTHAIAFAHADLSPSNVLIHEGRLAGIVDWEMAGWYPSYWEYTKAHYITFRRFKEWSELFDRIFPGYESELALELELWELTAPY
jgi:aminoglycoside phosphotransferase (APT) family kinase protein